MKKWISELETLLKNKKILEFYQDTILELEDTSYNNICNEIGSPINIANFENNLFVETQINSNDQKQDSNLKSIYLQLKGLNAKIIASNTKEVKCNVTDIKVQVIETEQQIKIIYTQNRHWKHLNQEILIEIPETKLIHINAVSCKLNVTNFNSNKLTCLFIGKHCDASFNNLQLKQLKIIASTHCKTNLKNSQFEILNVNGLRHLIFKCFNCKIKYLNSGESYSEFSFKHALIYFEGNIIEEVNLNQDFYHTKLTFINNEFFDCEFKGKMVYNHCKFKNNNILNYCEFENINSSCIILTNTNIDSFNINGERSRFIIKQCNFRTFTKNIDKTSTLKIS